MLINTFLLSLASANERVEPRFDERKWIVGYEANATNEWIKEYVLENETVENWHELITVYGNLGLQKNTTLTDYVRFMEKVMETTCSSVHWNIVQATDSNILYEWNVKGCAKAEDQTEMARAILGSQGIYLVRYTIKNSEVSPPTRQKWINLLNSARISD